ncbi:hypothetical protein [Sorangium sp. So ce887]|uniref:hypothetical protein n=1 Tax=Sorangium sp. So ce887 TaxID=3133324 RepID=UPI003F63FAB2
MPTLEHNALVEMFREDPALAPRLLATLFHVEVPPHASVAVVESSLDQLIPVEFRADLVLELRDASGTLVLAIVIEVQRDVDPDKTFSWPAYVAGVRARKRCRTIVLVIAPDAGVAAWAAENIDLGLGLGHVGRLDPADAMVYFQLIWNGLREPMRQALEALVMERQIEGEATFPPFVQKLIDRGKLEGTREGTREGKLEGMREGKLEARGIRCCGCSRVQGSC